MHDATVVVWFGVVICYARLKFVKISLSILLDILIKDGDIFVSIVPHVFMVQTQDMANFVNDYFNLEYGRVKSEYP